MLSNFACLITTLLEATVPDGLCKPRYSKGSDQDMLRVVRIYAGLISVIVVYKAKANQQLGI